MPIWWSSRAILRAGSKMSRRWRSCSRTASVTTHKSCLSRCEGDTDSTEPSCPPRFGIHSRTQPSTYFSGERMRSVALISALILLASPVLAQRFTGYTDRSTATQRQAESALKSIPSEENEKVFHRYFTAEPHPAGSEENYRIALHIAEEWKRQGWDEVIVHQYDVLNSAPRQVTLEMVEPSHYVAGLREAAYEIDPDTSNPRVSGAYLAMSASGDVTAPLVYARGGNPEDYDFLAQKGIDVRGKVVIVRYSEPYSYRGFK